MDKIIKKLKNATYFGCVVCRVFYSILVRSLYIVFLLSTYCCTLQYELRAREPLKFYKRKQTLQRSSHRITLNQVAYLCHSSGRIRNFSTIQVLRDVKRETCSIFRSDNIMTICLRKHALSELRRTLFDRGECKKSVFAPLDRGAWPA